jgi:hypothetical protein
LTFIIFIYYKFQMETNHRQLKMADFTMEELGVFVTLCMASCGGLLAIIWKSRCKRIKTLCFECDREVLDSPEKKPVIPQPTAPKEEKPSPPQEAGQEPTLSPSPSNDVASPPTA